MSEPTYRSAALAALAAVLAAGALFVVAEEAEANHFWSGSLSWERVLPRDVTDVTGADAAVRVTGYLSWDSTPAQFQAGGPGCDKSVGSVVPQDAANLALLYVNGVQYNYVMKIVYADTLNPPLGHCRFAAKMLDPSQVGTELGVLVPMPPAGAPIEVWWGKDPSTVATFCCRENMDHRNNANKPATMMTILLPGDPNSSPVIDFKHLTRITSHGAAAYGNHHCPRYSICKFYVEASDPDNDTLKWRKATPDEAGAGFVHPGPRLTGPFNVDAATGLVTWDTTGANVGDIFSTQIIVEDGITQVPVDFMVEIGPGCDNGATGVLDPITGELICESDPEPPEPQEPCELNPDDDGCRPVPPKPPGGQAYEHTFWPPPHRQVLVAPAVSDSEGASSDPADGTFESLSKLDSDGDSVPDELDRCLGSDTLDNSDADLDGLGDGCDEDDDGDGVADELDACPADPDPRCKLASKGKDLLEGQEAARGFLQASEAPEKEPARVALHEARDDATGGLPLLGALAAAFVLLLLVAGRRRRRDDPPTKARNG